MSAVNPSQAVAATVVDELTRCGLRHVCLSPGSRSAPIAMAVAAEPRLDVHVSIDERSASFCALGIARARREAAAVVCTSGTAAANFHPAVIEASLGRVPLIVLTADRPPELRGTGANQTADQIKLYGSAVRWFCEVGAPVPSPNSARYWRSMACRAWAEASASPPGPVHLNFALPEPLVPVEEPPGWPHPLDGRPGDRPWTLTSAAPSAAAERDVEHLRETIANVERGVIVAGACDTDPGPVLDLAAAAAWPVLAEPASGLRAGDSAVSTYDALLRSSEFVVEHRPDFVLRIGKTGISRALEAYLGAEVSQVLIDRDAEWLDPGRALSRIVPADPAATCAAINEELPERGTTPWLRSWTHAEKVVRSGLDATLSATDHPSEPRAARDLAAALPNGSTLTVAASMPVRDLDSFMAPRTGLRILANRGANGIDGFVSTTIGVAVAQPTPVAALCGDLALLHDQNGLLIAREDVSCTFVVINNDGGGIFSFLPQAAFPDVFEQLFGTPHGVNLRSLAAVYGARYTRLEHAADLGGMVGEATESDGITLIEVPTNRKDNVELHRRLWDAAARALS